jgi:hypothetical protein
LTVQQSHQDLWGTEAGHILLGGPLVLEQPYEK